MLSNISPTPIDENTQRTKQGRLQHWLNVTCSKLVLSTYYLPGVASSVIHGLADLVSEIQLLMSTSFYR